MAQPLTVSIGNKALTIDSGDLASTSMARFATGALSLGSDVFAAVQDKPISSLSSDFLQESISVGQALSWSVGNITLNLTPQFQGTVTIHKGGEIFHFTEAEKDDDDSMRQVVTVPSGKAYVSISFRVNLEVEGSGSYSSGSFGVKGSVELTDNFLLANHVQVDADTKVLDAIEQAFGHFVLPFTDTAYLKLADGNFLEYQFYGKLGVSLTASLGFTGVFFGGFSGGELRRCLSSPVGSVSAQAKPELDLSASFTIAYQHEDAFRIVLRGLPDRSRLHLFKMDQSTLSAALKAGAGVSVNASVNLDNPVDDLLGKASSRIFAGVKDNTLRSTLCDQFTSRAKEVDQATKVSKVEDYISDTQDKINDQLQKLDRLKVSASLASERISENTTLLTIDFLRTAAAQSGFQKAMQGDMAGAVLEKDVDLAPGSYTRSEISRSTSMSLQLFDTFRASSIETYFEKSDIRYAGNGIFQMRFLTGVKADNDVFGHRKAIEFYFEVMASATATGAISDQDINLRIKTYEEKNAEAARRTAALLHLLLRGTSQDGLDDILRGALTTNPNLTVSLSIVFKPSAYNRLRFTPFLNGKPQASQTADALNYGAFVAAVGIIYAGGGFGAHGFPDQVNQFKNWAHYNVTVNDQEDSTAAPNRRLQGNANAWPQDPTNFPAATVSDQGIRHDLRMYLMAAQQFMNLCEDLPALSRDLDDATTQAKLDQVLAEIKDLVTEATGGFPLFFTKPAAAALFSQTSGTVTDVRSRVPGDATKNTFDVQVVVA